MEFLSKGYSKNPILVHIMMNAIKTCEIGEYLGMKNCASKECVIDNLGLIWEDEMLNKTEATLNVNKKVTHKKDHCLLHIILFAFIFVSSYFY